MKIILIIIAMLILNCGINNIDNTTVDNCYVGIKYKGIFRHDSLVISSTHSILLNNTNKNSIKIDTFFVINRFDSLFIDYAEELSQPQKMYLIAHEIKTDSTIKFEKGTDTIDITNIAIAFNYDSVSNKLYLVDNNGNLLYDLPVYYEEYIPIYKHISLRFCVKQDTTYVM